MKYSERLLAWGEPPTFDEISNFLNTEEGRSAREVRQIINQNRLMIGKKPYGDTILHRIRHPLAGGIRKRLFQMEEIERAKYGIRKVNTRFGIEQVFRGIENPLKEESK